MIRVMFFFILLSAVFAESRLEANSREEFLKLARYINSIPITLISKEGGVYPLKLAAEGHVEGQSLSITDADGQPYRLPSQATVFAFPGEPGQYFYRIFEAGSLTHRAVSLSNGTLRVGRPQPAISSRGALTPLYDRHLARHSLRGSGNHYITFYRPDQGSGAYEEIKTINLDYASRRIGPVTHPETGEPGIAVSPLIGANRLTAYFPHSDPIDIEFPPGTRLFTADQDRILVGQSDKDCASLFGMPEGLCSAHVLLIRLPAASATFDLNNRSDFVQIARPIPGFTFGFNYPLLTDTDFKLVGDTLLVIAQRGPKQKVLQFDLKNPGVFVEKTKLQDGVELSFVMVGGPEGRERVTINTASYSKPRTTIAINIGSGEVSTVYTSSPYQQVTDLDLEVKTIDTRTATGIPPYTIIAHRPAFTDGLCPGGEALVQVYGGSTIPLEPFNILGLTPSLFATKGTFIAAHIRGGGGYGSIWAAKGSYDNAHTQPAELLRLVRDLRKSGCERISLVGQSYGGVVALLTAIQAPSKIDAVIAVATPLDIQKEFEQGNKEIAALLPIDDSDMATFDFSKVSPHAAAASAADFSGLNILLVTGANDRRVTTDKDMDAISLLRSKGANVRLIVRDGLGHELYRNKEDWAEYHYILSKGLELARRN